MDKDLMKMVAAYIATLLGFTSIQLCGCESYIRIRSVYMRGYVDFWPTTGKYLFSDTHDCVNCQFSALNISLSELVNGIKGGSSEQRT